MKLNYIKLDHGMRSKEGMENNWPLFCLNLKCGEKFVICICKKCHFSTVGESNILSVGST